MSFAGRAANSNGSSIGPRAPGTGLPGCAGPSRCSLLIGRYAMETAGHREPCDSRGSCTVLGAPEGESPSGDSTTNKCNPGLQVCAYAPISDFAPHEKIL